MLQTQRTDLKKVLLVALLASTSTVAFGGPVHVGPGNRLQFETGLEMSFPDTWVSLSNESEFVVTNDAETLASTASFETSADPILNPEDIVETNFELQKTVKIDAYFVKVYFDTYSADHYTQKKYEVIDADNTNVLTIRSVYSSQADETSFEAELLSIERAR